MICNIVSMPDKLTILIDEIEANEHLSWYRRHPFGKWRYALWTSPVSLAPACQAQKLHWGTNNQRGLIRWYLCGRTEDPNLHELPITRLYSSKLNKKLPCRCWQGSFTVRVLSYCWLAVLSKNAFLEASNTFEKASRFFSAWALTLSRMAVSPDWLSWSTNLLRAS